MRIIIALQITIAPNFNPNPIFPLHASKSRMTPTLTGIVVFCALAKKLLSERIIKKKREKEILVGIIIIMFEYLGSFKVHGLK